MADRNEPWAERTVEAPPGGENWPPFTPLTHGPPPPSYHRGVAPVGSRGGRGREQTHGYGEQQPTREHTWHDGDHGGQHGGDHGHGQGQPRAPMRYQLRQLRRGAEWTWIGGLFAFVCWGIWTVSVRGSDLVVPTLAFVLVLLVAVGVFTLSRLLGRVVIERGLGRVRRSAWAAHMVTGLFLLAAGVAYLGQTAWIIDAWNYVRGI